MVFCYEMLTTPGKHECKKPPPPYPTGGTHNPLRWVIVLGKLARYT